MKNSAKRFFYVTSAILLGIGVVITFIFLGRKANGPISGALNDLGNRVIDIEQDYLLSKREPVRTKKLEWFNKYRENINLLKHPDTILWGVYENSYEKSFANILTLDDMLHNALPLIQIYTAWGDKHREEFPMLYAKAIYNLGSTPIITWEPWLNDFDREEHNLPPVIDPNKNGMAAVARGDYDFYIESWAKDVKEFGENIFIRLGHEMNDPYRYPWGPQNNESKDFVAAWRHIVNIFNKNGAKNVVWIWAPQPAYLRYGEYYPGDEYVDWIGVGALNYGTVASWSKWWSFGNIVGNYYVWLDMYKKPIMITEMSSLSVGGKREDWFKDALTNMPTKYPNIKAIVLFNDNDDKTTLNKSLNWSIVHDTATCDTIRQTILNNW